MGNVLAIIVCNTLWAFLTVALAIPIFALTPSSFSKSVITTGWFVAILVVNILIIFGGRANKSNNKDGK
jgi:hypothetical protein